MTYDDFGVEPDDDDDDSEFCAYVFGTDPDTRVRIVCILQHDHEGVHQRSDS